MIPLEQAGLFAITGIPSGQNDHSDAITLALYRVHRKGSPDVMSYGAVESLAEVSSKWGYLPFQVEYLAGAPQRGGQHPGAPNGSLLLEPGKGF